MPKRFHWVGLAVLLAVAPLSAGELPPLRWGADRNGGGPYVFDGPDGRLTGFEWDLAQHLGRELGREPEFVQGTWDQLPHRLDRGDLDVVLNGYEWSLEREAAWDSTVPYYVYALQLLARKDDASVRSWEDLGRGPRRKVGVLAGSAAQRLAQERLAGSCEILAYDGVTSVLRLVEQGQLDATVQDTPIVAHYLQEFPGLARVGEPQAPGTYVMFLRKGDGALRQRLNEAVLKGLRDGTLKGIYERYGLWDAGQERLLGLAASWPPSQGPAPSRGVPWKRLGGELALGAWMTLKLSFLAMPLAMALGLLVALGRLYGPGWLSCPLGGYVEVLRGTPVLLQLFVIYYLLPGLGVRLPPFWAGVLALGINYSAYEAENYRAGLLAVPRGQLEAALALGMDRGTALRRVVVPQAVRLVVPPVTNDFISLFKDTSVCYVIGVSELATSYQRLYNNHPRLALELGLGAAALYLLMSYPLAVLARRLERGLQKVRA